MDDFFVIKNFKSSQPQGYCGLKFSLASKSPHISSYSKVSKIKHIIYFVI